MTLLRFAGALVGLVTAVGAIACGGSGGSESGPGGTIDGSSLLGWDQAAADTTAIAAMHFVMYVDDVRNELAAASCTLVAGSAGFPCSSRLPPMSSGQHTIQLASYVVGALLLESPKSAPLVIDVSTAIATTAGSVAVTSPPAASTAPARPAAVPRNLVTSDGVRLQVEVIAQVDRPSALAVSEAGAVFVADASGQIRIVGDGARAGEHTGVSGIAAAEDGAVLDIALDPQFARNHSIYVLEAVAGPPASFRLSRLREAGGRLGQRAVLLDGVPAAPGHPSGALAFGPDTRLYVALDDGGDAEAARRAGSYNGKVLRLSADGTTPADQSGASPIYAASLQAPRSLAWDAAEVLWVADVGARQASRIRSSGGSVAIAPYRLPLAGGPASLAVYRGALMPALQGNLLVAPRSDSSSLLRVRFSGSDRNATASTEALDVATAESVRLVRVGPDGAIYVGTDREVLRITPR